MGAIAMNSNNAIQPLTPRDEALLEQVLIELVNENLEKGGVLDAEIVEAYYREGYIPSADCDRMLGELLLEGPGQYLGVIVRGLNERCDALRSQLLALRDDPDRKTAISRLGDISKGRYWLLQLFLKSYPRPPFSIIQHLLPVRYEVIVHFCLQRPEKQIQGYLCDLILELPAIEEYLMQPEATPYRNPISRFFGSRCQAAKRRRFLRSVNRLIVASESLRGYVITYLEPYLLTLHFQQEYQEHSDHLIRDGF
ncbi:hypothetical protein C8B47_03380 [filamentous cyanobacterium CCP4]|nr:hypothetical protein C8B47_03380 [filamentous cyanobacterium CCP4]